jgi:2,5-dihydroxypyridine 5,6-dioxygenase
MRRRDFVTTAAAGSLAASAMPSVLLPALGRAAELRESAPASPELVELFTRELRLCKVQQGETVLFYSTPSYAHPAYIDATLAAARALGANAFALTALPGGDDAKLLLEAFKAANLVVGQIPLYTDAHNAALASGTRTLMVGQDAETLRRMFPDETVIKRTYAGARRMAAAKEIRVTDAAGTNLILRKDGRKGHAQVGISATAGRWDHWPSGLVACAPLEDQARGVFIVNPGDVILGLRLYAQTPVRMTLESGRIVRIEGGTDADMIRERLQLYAGTTAPAGQLSDPFRISHAGWGTEHRAQWHIMGMDSESLYGNVMISLGRNMFDARDEFSGLGGKNYTPVHIDICCRKKRLSLDGEAVVDNDRIVPAPLA